MHLVNIYLPKLDDKGQPFPDDAYVWIRTELIEQFGGITQYDQAPATGYWKEDPEKPVSQDEVINYEIICERLSKSYWAKLRKKLEISFNQEKILIRAHPVKIL